MPLFKVATPKNVSIAFGFLMQIAAFELLPAETIYNALFNADIEAEALNERYEELGLEHWLILNNMGTFGLILLLSSLLYLIYYLIACLYCFKVFRRARKKLQPKLFWGFLLRMVIEGYMITCICCLLNLRRLDFSMESEWIFTNSFATLVVAPILVLFPIFSICYMYSNFY